MSAQPLGLTYRNMINQAAVDTLNSEAKAMMTASNDQMSAEDAIEAVADSWGFVFVERDGGTALIQNADGQYATIWYESQFGQAMDIYTANEYDADAVGFDNQELGWGEVPSDDK